MFGRKKKEKGRKPIDCFFTRYIGHKSTYWQIPSNQDVYLYIFEDEIAIQFPKVNKTVIMIPYTSMVDIENIDAGDRVDFDRVMALGIIGGTLWKKKQILTVIKYNDENLKEQKIALDLEGGIQKVQPMIYERMQKAKDIG